jgi:predicted nuclease with TOPRIM domain
MSDEAPGFIGPTIVEELMEAYARAHEIRERVRASELELESLKTILQKNEAELMNADNEVEYMLREKHALTDEKKDLLDEV